MRCSRFHEARDKLSDTLKEISELSGRKKLLQLSETLLLPPFSDDVTKKDGKLIKEAFFSSLVSSNQQTSTSTIVPVHLVQVPVPYLQVPVQVPVPNLQVPVPVQVLCINYWHSSYIAVAQSKGCGIFHIKKRTVRTSELQTQSVVKSVTTVFGGGGLAG